MQSGTCGSLGQDGPREGEGSVTKPERRCEVRLHFAISIGGNGSTSVDGAGAMTANQRRVAPPEVQGAYAGEVAHVGSGGPARDAAGAGQGESQG